ncbi:universal stress protein [Streptomyces flavofungini]|uniref:universal stress protein n=1 Tax=Streptomyces flavofungini TaxID=68200 RepID=UPI0034DE5C96
MTLPLVVGVDGSDACLLAVDWATDAAARHQLPLRLVHGSLWQRYEGALPAHGMERPPGRVLSEHIVASAAARAGQRHPDVAVSTGIVPDAAAAALLREGNNATALVTGSRGRGGLTGVLLGSVGLAVAARAHCPVIVVRGDRTALAGDHERIVLCAGESGTGGEAVRFAFQEAAARGCLLDAVRAWRCPVRESDGSQALSDEPAHHHRKTAEAQLDVVLDDVKAYHPSVRVHRTTAEGPAHKVLLDRSAAADLVVIGARRRHGHRGLQLGLVAHTLLHHAPCPVAVVPELL